MARLKLYWTKDDTKVLAWFLILILLSVAVLARSSVMAHLSSVIEQRDDQGNLIGFTSSSPIYRACESGVTTIGKRQDRLPQE
ncbi:hypothetical protein ACO2I3_01045 [Leptospira interrogans]